MAAVPTASLPPISQLLWHYLELLVALKQKVASLDEDGSDL